MDLDRTYVDDEKHDLAEHSTHRVALRDTEGLWLRTLYRSKRKDAESRDEDLRRLKGQIVRHGWKSAKGARWWDTPEIEDLEDQVAVLEGKLSEAQRARRQLQELDMPYEHIPVRDLMWDLDTLRRRLCLLVLARLQAMIQ